MKYDKAQRAMWRWAEDLPVGEPARISYVSRGQLVIDGESVPLLATAGGEVTGLLGYADGRWFVTLDGARIVALNRSGEVVQEYPTFPRSSPNHDHDLIVSPDGRLMVKDRRLIRTRDAEVIGRTPKKLYSTNYWTDRGLIYSRLDPEKCRSWIPGQHPRRVPCGGYYPDGQAVDYHRGCYSWVRLTRPSAAEPTRAQRSVPPETCSLALIPMGVDSLDPDGSAYISASGLIVDKADAQPRPRSLGVPRRAFFETSAFVTALWENPRSVLLSIPAEYTWNPKGWESTIVVRCPVGGTRCSRLPGVVRYNLQSFKMLAG